MKKTNFTFYSKLTRPLIMVFGLMLLNWGVTNAQCSLGCTYSIQVSLDDEDCEATITYNDLLTDSTTCPDGVFMVELRYNDILLPQSPTITSDYVGKTIEAKVIDTESGNSCWGYISVEDKLAPVIECENPGPLFCFEEQTYTPEVIENCGLYTLYVTDSIVQTNNCDGTFADGVLRRVTKTYKAVDQSGNESEECTISYNVRRLPNLSQDYIKRPQNYLYPNDNLLCNDVYKKDINGNPHPDVTGYPRLDGKDLKPDEILMCNLLVDYSDDVIKDVQCVTKILRTWSILEWSCGNTRTREILQMIEIADTNDPIITGVKDITISTTPHHCEALATIPPAMVADSCTDTEDITVTISGGTPLIVGNGGQTMLPVGDNVLTYVATDACGNTSSAQITVTVKDLTPPVAVCDQNTTVSVTTDGLAWVPAQVFDDGSYDECALDRLVVRRMDPTTCEECERPDFDGYHYLGKYNDKYYYLSSWPSNFHVAKKYAHSLGGELAITNTADKAEWVHEKVLPYLQDGDMYYIGLERIGDTKDFKWLDNSPVTYTNWANNQPNNNNGIENAVEVRENGRWNDIRIHDENKYVIEISDPCGFSDYVKFCCADVGTDHMVVLRAIDQAGNYNDCMVNAEIQDKLPPTIVCPADLTIDCDEYYPTGDLVADYGNYTYFDNCENPRILDTIIEEDVNQCNVGYLIRRITATDAGGRFATCEQRIDIIGRSYNFSDFLDFPRDVTVNTCEDPTSDQFHPDNTGRPIFTNDDQCNLLGADYHDKVFTFNNPNGEACFKIIRTWSFIDWCEFNGLTHTVYTRDQIIKVHDETTPEITSSCERKSTCTYDASCADGFIELTATATDACTDVLDYFWKIDVGNNGVFEGGFYKGQPLSGTGKANMINASGVYPVGNHRIQYTFADKCGNVVTCDQLFDIVNCKAPTPYCLNGLAVDLMPVTDQTGEVVGGMVELWANDFDAGSFHTCPEYKVYVSFSENILDTGRVFTCADLGRADVMIFASVITPMGDTLRSFCNTFVDVQDNMGACGDDLRVGVFGNIHTSDDRDLLGADVTLEGVENVLVNTNTTGDYTFGQMPVGGDYNVVPKKNDDYMNGISTLDLVLIQRHILGIQAFEDPYMYLAADINKDNNISAADLVDLRKLILGVTNEFANNDSWRFIDDNVQFSNGTNPLGSTFNETYAINNLDSDMEINFTSVKVGDINGNVVTNARDNNSEPRSANTLTLVTDNKEFSEGETVKFTLNSENATSLSGLQFTINFDANNLVFEGLNGVEMNIDQNNLGLVHLEDGMITFSWNNANVTTVDELFELSFKAVGNGNIANSFNVTSDVTKAEAYNSVNEVMEVEFRTSNSNNGLVLYQNVPNPFNDVTTISFNMPSKGQATMSILDVTGKLIYTNTNTYNKGVNSLTFNKAEHNLSGVMYYQLTVNDETLVKKMVVIE